MNCNEAVNQIQPFIDDKLSLKETEAFLKHILSCKECYDELEVCYMVVIASRGLENDNVENYDLGRLLENKITETEKRIWVLELFRSIRIISLLGALTIAVFLAVKFIWGL